MKYLPTLKLQMLLDKMLAPALILSCVGIVVMAVRIHPVLGFVTLCLGWMAYSARRRWFDDTDDSGW